MQIFAPFISLEDIARCLDNKRLNKQVLETRQIIRVIEGIKMGYRNHPAVKMYTPYLDFLRLYHNIMRAEWVHRGKNSNMPDEPLSVSKEEVIYFFFLLLYCNAKVSKKVVYPSWWGKHDDFHSCHRANLLSKDSVHYGQFGWQEKADDKGYWWNVDGEWKFIVKGEKRKRPLKRLQTRLL